MKIILKEKYKKIKSKYLIFLLFFAIIFIPILTVNIRIGSDDTTYIEQLSSMKIFDWLYMRVKTWQPRIISDFLIAIFNFNMPVWKFATTIITALLMFFICNFSQDTLNKREYVYSCIISFASFFLINIGSLNASVFWYTGSFNYLWPSLFMIIALMPFYRADINKPVKCKFIYILAAVCSALIGYNEQFFAVAIGFGAFTFFLLILEKRKIPVYLIIQYILILINAGIFFKLGGVSIRRSAEVIYFKDYDMLSFADKIFLGVNWGNYQVFNNWNILFFIPAGLIFIIGLNKFNSSALKKALFAVPMIVIGLSIVRLEYIAPNIFGNIYKIFDTMYIQPTDNLIKPLELFPSLFCMTIILYMAVLIFYAFENKAEGLSNVALYLASLCSGYILGFSPTIFESGLRIFFISDILIVLLISNLTKELFKFEIKKWFKIIVFLLFAVSLCPLAAYSVYNLAGEDFILFKLYRYLSYTDI